MIIVTFSLPLKCFTDAWIAKTSLSYLDTTKDSLQTKHKDIALSGFRSYSRPNFIFSKDEVDIINNLKNDNNIFIMKPDKGNGVVIIDRSDYYKKMDDILSDTNKFRKLDVDPITHSIRQENQVKNFLRELKKNGTISEIIYDNLFPSGSRPGILYGLPKVHKLGVPLRPILSSIGTHSYGLAKFLVPLLRPISTGTHMVSDSFSFIQDLFALDVNSDTLTMVSFDIKSLFTNIPLDETIDIIVSKLFNNSTHFQNFTRSEFTQLLSFAVKNCHFFFNGVLFEQTDGVAMGSPLGPTFADIFLSWHEHSWLSNCPTHFKPVYYHRYVDDCFLLPPIILHLFSVI